ncbi:MAG: hypothetical protein GY752_04390 [bacterium]|nr:hypothetical protein [bacterium]MCP4801133.1 hypothetical protein [bacterium]
MKRNELQRIAETLDALGVEEIEDRLEISPILPGDGGDSADTDVCDCCYRCSKPIEWPDIIKW